ncbi:hypothetical protein GS456_01095 [Rhodococcus hoagii]|nr:hypothetical protein [Prescottella equi]
MTVLIVAHARDGVVFAADGRTCLPGPPSTIDIDDAKKVRVHRYGSRGLIAGSSGRAKIGGKRLHEIEAEFIADRTDVEVSPGALALHYRELIDNYNRELKCHCSLSEGQCVLGADTILQQEAQWFDDRTCPCSPGDGLATSTPPNNDGWCKCRAQAEPGITLICASFPASPISILEILIPPVAASKPYEVQEVTKLVTISGELASGPGGLQYRSNLVADALNDSAPMELGKTVDQVRTLMSIAYRDAGDSATARALGDENLMDDYRASSLINESVDMSNLAHSARAWAHSEGRDLDAEIGSPSIGGSAMIYVLPDSGCPKKVHTDDNYGLPTDGGSGV